MDNYLERYDSGVNALEEMVDKSGKTPTDLSYFLQNSGYWPESLTHDSLTSRFRETMNRCKPAFFKFAEIIELMNYTKRYDPLFFACDVLGFERPRKKITGHELQDLTETVKSAMHVIESAKKEITKLANEQERANCIAQKKTETQSRTIERFCLATNPKETY